MTDPRIARLPPILAQIAEASSVEAALSIARRHGGTRVTMPVRATGRNWLTALVGPDDAAAIINHIGGVRRIDVPLAPGEGWYAASQRVGEELAHMLKEGNPSNRDLARALGTTERSIRRRKARRRAAADSGQGDLFGI